MYAVQVWTHPLIHVVPISFFKIRYLGFMYLPILSTIPVLLLVNKNREKTVNSCPDPGHMAT